MERIHTLIDKLSQQKKQGASPAHLLFTVQLLQQELAQLQKNEQPLGSRKVAVILPFNTNLAMAEAVPVVETVVADEPVEEKEIYVLDLVEEEPEAAPAPATEPLVQEQREYSLRKPVVQESLFEPQPVAAKEEARPAYSAQSLFNSAFEATAAEVPTLAQYATATEVHEKIATKAESLNDRLKREQTEVAHLLKDAPIKDLRKAVGINDRFTFVRELFRGDEAAYERSIKTINNFNIYSEAEFWMSRELKLKLGWDDRNEAAQQFYQLVRRRFS